MTRQEERFSLTPSPWTDERIETMKRLWNEGKSAAEIATLFGSSFTRNAVIGKLHRAGLGREGLPVHRPRPRKPRHPRPPREKIVRPPLEAFKEAAPLPEPVIAPVPEGPPVFIETVAGCRYAIGTIDGRHHFCNRPVADPDLKLLWCSFHYRAVYVKYIRRSER